MDVTRRMFLAGAGCAGAGSLVGAAAPGTHDPDLMVFFADFHQHDNTARWANGPTHQNEIFPRYVAEVLAMRPLPAHAVVFGDFSASCGWDEDFRLAAAALKPLADAGITLTLGMGNHDNRAAFLRAFPDYRARMLLPERIVSKVSTPHADLLLLDTLKTKPGAEWAEPSRESNRVEGAVDPAQRAWLRDTLAAATRPTFVGAHHSARECGLHKEIVTAPTVFGYIFGHEHEWAEHYLHDGTYGNSQTVQTATLPSAGFYGDLGYALFRTFPDRAELTLRQTDFFFNRPWPDRPRPKNWLERVRRHRAASVTFWYDKPENFRQKRVTA